MTWRYFSYEQEQALKQVLALTSVDNDVVRELRQLLAGNIPMLEKVSVLVEGEQVAALRCPHCGAEHVSGAEDGPGISVLDLDVRFSTFYYDAESSCIHGSYNDESNYETYGYECESCDQDVRLPEGVTEEGEG